MEKKIKIFKEVIDWKLVLMELAKIAEEYGYKYKESNKKCKWVEFEIPGKFIDFKNENSENYLNLKKLITAIQNRFYIDHDGFGVEHPIDSIDTNEDLLGVYYRIYFLPEINNEGENELKKGI